MGKKRKQSSKNGAQDAQPSQKRPKTAVAETVNFDGDLDGATATALDKSAFSEQLSGEERKREAAIYELLGSVDVNERIQAADALITGLLGGQGSPEPVLRRHLEKRLFRGLASSRNASRVGFSLVLTEILGQLFGTKDLAKTKFPGLTFDKVLDLLLDTTQAGGNLPGQEERDYYFGQLFGLQCFVEAKILFDDDSRWHKILDLLLKAAEKKVWLRSHCGWVIVEALPHMGQARAEDLLKKLSELGWAKTAEGVGIWLRARTIYPGIKTPAKPWRDPLAPGSIPELARVLKENVKSDTGDDKNGPKVKQGNASAQLNFVWDLILASFSTRDGTPRSHDKDLFKQFWSTVVDDGLFSKNATDGQKYRGFMIFQKFITGFGPEDKTLVLDLFTKNLMRCLVNQAAAEDRYLHRAALRCLDVIDQAVKASPELLVPVLKQLLGKWGAYDFDQKTNTKTVEKLMQWATMDNADEVLKLLREPVVVMKAEEKEVENFRQVYAQYILRLATQAKLESEPSASDAGTPHVLELAISELASGAYTVSEEFKPELSEKSREVFRSRLSSAFARLTKRKEDFKHLCNAVASVKPTAVAMSEDLEAERATALKAMKKQLKASKKAAKGAKEESSSSSSTSLGLALLYAVAILQLYNGAPDAIDLLQDLKRCSEKTKDDEQSGTSELLVEILLSLVSQQSSLMRQISQQVFEAFTSQISAEALELLTEPLVAEENQRGYQALFENLDDEDMVDADDVESDGDEDEEAEDDDDDVEDVEEDDISEIGSDVEFTTLNGDAAEEDDDDDDNDDDDEDEEDEEDATEAKELADFDDALAKLLKSRRLDQDAAAASNSDDDDDDDESDMTDSEMMQLDEKLVEVFKQRAQKSKASKTKEKRDAKETVLNFKRRVLELLDIYVKQEASRPVAFNVLLPLLQLVRTTTDKSLTDKAIKAIEAFAGALKKKQAQAQALPSSTASAATSERQSSKGELMRTETQLDLLKRIHHEATQGQTHAFAKAASRASLVVASSLFTSSSPQEKADKIRLVARAYADTQAQWASGAVKMQALFFSDWLNWCQGQASNASQSQQQQQKE
ncbi:DNA polymerase phi-domain-containing protein [Microdochium trichocladiopsis]|uniref:DNA polymerase phi-domain-containing protein n=1 Tax=Microdochium trichocladiopsis TaxID=1682393 RepID=A0A9P8Y4A8_9PEZI|nr:DNA polymerase phi-domain-containing protein [Microdochium trichocladiopsis]KAH7027306.1 DNA polymerase phi-domain-containing protein [Microdochium trichocladiopsis]